MGIPAAVRLLHAAARKWRRDRADIFAASVAYYSVFSLAPLVMFGVSVISLRAGPEESRRVMSRVVDALVGARGAEAVRPMIVHAGQLHHSAWATAISLATLMYGASTLFFHLQDALNVIFEAPQAQRGGFARYLKRRLLSFMLVLGMPVLLLAGPGLSAVLAALGRSQSGSIALSLTIETALFAFIFKVLPDVRVPWEDIWAGAMFTAALFTLGQTLLGFYLNGVAARSVYGAASSLVALLVWIHVSAQIMLFGAEVIQTYKKGSDAR